MSDNSSDSSRSSLSADRGQPSQNQKLTKFLCLNPLDNDDVLGDNWESSRMRRTLETLRNGLLQTEATVIQNFKLRIERKDVPGERNNVPTEQLQMNEDIIQQLQEDLETSITRAHDARAAQAAAEAELSQLNTTMTQHIAEAVAFLQEETARQKELSEEKMSTLEKELVHMEWLRQQVILLEEKCQESTPNVRKSKSIKTRGTPTASKVEYYDLIQENETLKFQIQTLREETRKLEYIDANKKQKTTNILRKIEDSSSEDPDPNSDDDLDDVESAAQKNNGEPDRPISLRRDGCLVSDRRYLDMDWTKEYESRGSRSVFCKKCSQRCSISYDMRDHVWYKHYAGSFICAYCTESRKTFSSRQNLYRHIKNVHHC